jgi:hypothetical protein
MQLVRLLYFSRNRLAQFGEPIADRLAELIGAGMAHNQRDRITGLLVYDEKWFVQALEGEAAAVSHSFERILRDPRHGEVTLTTMRPVATRRYGSTPLAAIARGEDNAAIFRQYAEGSGFDPRLMPADRLAYLVEALLQDAARCPRKSRSAFRGTAWTIGNATNAA